MKDLVIGAADNYGWDKVRNWATSIKSTGFDGDVVLIAYRVTQELVDKCTELGIHVIIVNHDETAREINHTSGNLPTQSHKLRNFHIWQYLSENPEYRMVTITDTRDVIFQTNPTTFFDTHMEYDIYFPSEGVRFKDESWNMGMIHNLFGPFISESLKDGVACNSGTMFGKADAIKKLMLKMYLIAKNFGATGSDQPTMNVLIHLTQPDNTTILPIDEGWGCQCGTILNPKLSSVLVDPIPTIKNIDNKQVFVNSKSVPFVLVHQYDRLPDWGINFNYNE
jgi:hypothetical protein